MIKSYGAKAKESGWGRLCVDLGVTSPGVAMATPELTKEEEIRI